MRRPLALTVLAFCTMMLGSAHGQSRWASEPLGRSLVAAPVDANHVYLSWRLLDTDPPDVAFLIERRAGNGSAQKRTARAITETTDFIDEVAAGTWTYELRVAGAKADEKPEVAIVTHPGQSSEPGPVQTVAIENKATVQKVGVADLDGDGAYDFVVKTPKDNIDPYENYWNRSPDTYNLEAYSSTGKFLWRFDLGWAIERGIWYSPYVVYDLDGDGKAEVAVKTGEGDPRDADGRVQTGPEYLTILDGLTGKPRTRLDWPDRKPFYDLNPGGTRGYNYASRNQLGIAYLDGKNPHLVVQRGTYNLMVVRAYRLENSELRSVWEWSNAGLSREYQGQGAHWLHSVDVDEDGRDELVLGSLVLDDDGKPLWTTGLGHPDHLYVGDIDPQRPGLEVYFGIETRQKRDGMCLADARTGKILWGHDDPTRHVHGQGLCSDLDAKYPGSECYSADTDPQKNFAFARLRSSDGDVISSENLGGFAPRSLFWDADPQRELLVKSRITDYQGEAAPGPRIQGDVVAVCDLVGDWREELITTVPGELRIYSTTIPASSRFVTLMRDPIYRADVAHAAMGYYQVPMLSFDLQSKAAKPKK